ncbi:MAG: tetratricopeptide repeat protein [Chloroflexi bacterium]|nr:tetratricopeptide repeat protein [Chloroflexota bacterium]
MNDDWKKLAEELFNRGNDRDQAGDRPGAINEWHEAIRFNPDHAAAHYNLGIAFSDDGDNARAMDHLRQAINLDLFDLDARHALAEIYLEEEQWDDAINLLRQTLNLIPSDGQAAHLLAEAYLDQEMWDEAAGALESGALLEEDADLWFDLGEAYQRADRIDDAILAYRRAIIAQPEHPDAIHALDLLHVPIEEEESDE